MRKNWMIAITAATIGFLLAACIFLSLWLVLSWQTPSKCANQMPVIKPEPRDKSSCVNGVVFPPKGATIDTRKPVFNLIGKDGYDDYRLQVDSGPSFPNPMTASKLPDGTFTLPMPLEDGLYFWRIACHSDEGAWLQWEPTWNFSVVGN
ncbi:hypothetical protein HYU11_06320 [Candidatus Woesearchaeota archaeon]|nr:hypothetical protein [Candidatus Woesearchaeota archaeon]